MANVLFSPRLNNSPNSQVSDLLPSVNPIPSQNQPTTTTIGRQAPPLNSNAATMNIKPDILNVSNNQQQTANTNNFSSGKSPISNLANDKSTNQKKKSFLDFNKSKIKDDGDAKGKKNVAGGGTKKKSGFSAVIVFLFLIVASASALGFVLLKTNLFAPQADESMQPSEVKISNITSDSFTISFITSAPVISSVKYGNNPSSNALKNVIYDDRNKTVAKESMLPSTSHHITVKGLSPQTTYYFKITITNPTGGFGSAPFDYGAKDDEPFQTQTYARNNQNNNSSAFGTVSNLGKPITGALIYAAVENANNRSSTLSTFTVERGNWRMPLTYLYDSTTGAPMTLEDTDTLKVVIVQPATGEKKTKSIPISQANESISVDIASDTAEEPAATPTPTPAPNNTTGEPTTKPVDTNLPASQKTVVDMQTDTLQIVDTGSPTISGKGSPNEKIQIKIDSQAGSEEVVSISKNVNADATGTYKLAASEISPSLKNGTYVVSQISADAKVVKKNIVVEAAYGSGNPVPLPTPVPTPEPTPVPTPVPEVVPEKVEEIPVGGVVENTIFMLLIGLFFLSVSLGSYLFIGKRD